MKTALAPLRADSRVASIVTPDSAPVASAAGLRSKDGKRALANVTVNGTTTEAEAFFPQLRALVHTDAFEVLATGNIPLNGDIRSEEHTSELQSQSNLVCRLLLEKKKKYT